MHLADSVFGTADLQNTCRKAVLDGRLLAVEVKGLIEGLMVKLQDSRLSVDGTVDAVTQSVMEADSAAFEELLDRLWAAHGAQGEEVSTVNVVLFGRTNIGKSTLITALTREDGRAVSRGGSDCTEEAARRVHGSLAVVDTPGIGGPGLTVATDVLEGRAAQALATADVVLLCLDTVNITDDTVAGVAQLVVARGKPLVVVLNARNPKWGRHVSAPGLAERRRLSREVAVYADHSRHRLGELGLVRVPVVVVQAGLAMYARAAEPYAGPWPKARRAALAEAGDDTTRLLAWSNLPALEALLAEALRGGAARLRRQARVNQLRGDVRSAGTAVADLSREASTLVERHESGITRALELVGSPGSLEQLGLGDGGLSAVRQRLERLEKSRGAPLDVAAHGSAQDLLESLITTHLSALRVHALHRADDIIGEALRARRDVSAEEFQRRVLLPAQLDELQREIHAAFVEHLERGLGLIAAEIQQDVSTEMAAARISGRPGRGLYRTGVAIGVASPVATAAGLLLLSGVITAWNPVGWGLVGAGMVLSVVGGLLRKRAEARRTRQLSEARGAARRVVNDYVDQLGRDLLSAHMVACRTVLVEQVRSTVDSALAMRELLDVQHVRRQLLADFESEAKCLALSPEDESDPQYVVAEAVRRCEATVARAAWPEVVTGPHSASIRLGEQARRDLWLGEAWAQADDAGGPEAIGSGTSGGPADLPRDDVTAALTAFLVALDRRCHPQAEEWLTEVHLALADDRAARRLLIDLRRAAQDTAVRVVICGDYNTGKSAFVARLHRELGAPVPQTLRSDADVTTQRSTRYRWGRYVLVDTPGFQSGHPRHREAARTELRDAALAVYLFNPTGVTAGLDDTLDLLMPRAGWGQTAAATTLFVINRMENLGLDPRDSPEEFMDLIRLKQLELARTLGRRLRVPPEDLHVVSVASAPYGDPADRQPWDGMAEVARAFAGDDVPAVVRLSVIAAVRAATIGLIELSAQAAAELEERRTRRERVLRLLEVLRRAVDLERALVEERTHRLVRSVDDILADIVDVALTHPQTDHRAAALGRLEAIDEDPELGEILRQWEVQSREASAQLRARVDDDVARRRVLAGSSPGRANDPGTLAGARPSGIIRVQDVRRVAARRFRGARAVLAQGGAAIGVLGRGGRMAATSSKALRGVRVLGSYVGAASVVLEVGMLVYEVGTGGRNAARRTAVFHQVRTQAQDWATAQADASDALWRLARHTGQLEILIEETEADLASLETGLRDTERRLETYRSLIHHPANILREDADADD